ncbi:MAG TPA: translocation/assembly module TamB domain-containing protein [Myxococcota bacterium]|nr:translocation/assembly module TamB domain-containing protein [Myxococcota bacterium]
MSATHPSARARILRVLGAVAGAAALLTLAAGGLALALSHGFERERLTTWLEARIGGALGAEVSIGALDGPLYPDLVLRGVRVVADGEPLATWGALRLRLDAGTLWTRRTLVVERIEVEQATLRLARGADGRWSFEPPARPGGSDERATTGALAGLRLEVREVDVAGAHWRLFAGALALEGDASLHAREIKLPLRARDLADSRAELALTVAPATIEDVSLERGALRLSLSDGELALAIDALEGRAGRVAGHARTALAPWLDAGSEARAELALRFEALDLEALLGRPEAESDLAGTFEAEVRRPAGVGLEQGELRCDLSLEPSRLAVGGLDTGHLVGRLTGGSWEIESLLARGEAFAIEAHARGPRGELGTLTGTLRLPDLGRLAPWIPADLPMRGSASLEADLAGPLGSPSGAASFAARGLTVRDVALGALDGRISSEAPGVLVLERFGTHGAALDLALLAPARLETSSGAVRSDGLSLALAGQPLTLDGGVSGDAFQALHVQAEAVEIGPIARLAGLDVPLSGRAVADLRLDGAFRHPRLSGTLDLAPLAVGDARAERLRLAFAPGDGLLDATAHVQAFGREVLAARLRGPLEAGGELLARAETRIDVESEGFDLALLAPLLPRGLAQPGGRLDLALHVVGGRPTPTIEGRVALADGRLAVALLGRVFEPIDGRAEISGRQLRLESLEIGGDAAARMTGTVDFAELDALRADLALGLRHFPLSRTRLLTANASGDVAVSGPLRAPRIRGGLTLENLLLRLPEAEDATLREIRIVSRSAEPAPLAIREGADEAASGWLDAAELDLALSVPRDSWVRGGGVELEVTGDVRARSAAGGPALVTGTAETVRGSYTFQGRRFRVRRGTATFDGSADLDPILDVEAAYGVRDVTILALVSGRASNPELQLSGDPPMSDADVLSYLVFGGPAAELGAGQQASFAGAAAQAASGVAAQELASLLGGSVPVDTFELDLGENGAPGGFSVGRYLGDRVFVRYGRTLGPRPVDEVRAEVQVTPRVSVESQITTDETGGLDVIWSYDY